MDNRKKWILIGLVSFSFLSILLTFIFNRDAPPVSALEIPQSTIDFFKKLSDLGHVKFDFVDSLDVDNFDNDKDYADNFKKIEDDNFIIYYRDKPKEKLRAKKTLEYANQAVPDLDRFFGKYYYARDVNNRKLPIYLAASKSDFSEIAEKVGGTAVSWAAGITFTTFSSDGTKVCEGIVLSSTVQDDSRTDLKKVVFHELAHYNHFHCMNILQKTEFMNWEVEGLASFFANDWNKEIPSFTQLSKYSLMKDPANYTDSYWMGYHAFGLASSKGRLKAIVEDSYSESLLTAIPQNAGCSMDEFDQQWRNYFSTQD